MPDPAHLRSLQQWMRAAITTRQIPSDARDSPDASDAPDALNALDANVDAVVRHTAELTAAQRLGLYRRSHELRLLCAMRASYPGVRHMLGDELFDEFALDYLRAHPSRGYTLGRLGDGFAEHLEATRPDADGEPETWPDLLIDLARLERTFAEVYDAPGAEGRRLPSSATLPIEPDARWLSATVELVPCLRLARCSFAAGTYLSAVRGGERPPLPAPAESFLAISRRDYAVTLTPIEERPYRLLERLARGLPIGLAAKAAEVDLLDAWRLVRGWADSSFWQTLHPGGPLADRSFQLTDRVPAELT